MRILGVLMVAMTLIMVSCSKEEWSATDNFLQHTYEELRDGALGGHHRCYKANFPLTLLFPDGSTQEVGDREQLVTTIKNWKDANPDAEERPTLQFPFTVTGVDGDTIEVNSEEEVRELRQTCRQHRNKHRRCGLLARFIDNDCFKVQLPISIVMADGDLITIEDRQDLRQLLRKWKKDRPDEVPEISFPITVTVKDTDEVLELENQEALEALIEECRG